MSTPGEDLAAVRVAAELEPTAHVQDGPTEYRIDIDAPGLKAHDFQIRLVGRLLHVTGRDLRTLGPDSTFEFVFRLPDLVDGDGLSASFESERLVVRALAAKSASRTIEITTGTDPD